MTHIQHGKWVQYTPEALPANAPAATMFARREGDNVDWYGYVNPHLDTATGKPKETPDARRFAADSVKFAAIMTTLTDGREAYVVGAAVYDENMIWPANKIVVEIPGYSGGDPQEELRNKIYDPATETFSDLPPPPQMRESEAKILSALDDIARRLAALENKGGA